jgi:IPT/TIG domain
LLDIVLRMGCPMADSRCWNICRGLRFSALGLLSLMLAGCGSNSAPPPPAADFSISASPSSVTVGVGADQTVTVSAKSINGFTGSIAVAVSGLPTGVTADPATFSLTPGNQQPVKLAAAASAQPGTTTLTFQGTSGSLTHNAHTSLSVAAPDFSLSASPSSLTLGIGGSQTVTVSANGIDGFTGSISVVVGGAPAGVTANPATFSLTPGTQQPLTLTAAASAQPGAATLTFQGTSGSLSHNAQTSLTLVLAVTAAHPPIRARYLRTNSFYDAFSLSIAPPHFTAYDAAHKQFFVSNPFENEIDVFDALQEIETARIPVPLAWGLDVSPYNGSLYVGTLIGDVYQVDTGTLSITQRYLSASIGPTGFIATTALVLSDGRLAVQGPAGGILGVDGYGSSAVWDPVTNSLDTGGGSVCNVLNEGALAVSGDRTRVLVTTVDEGGGGESICSYDPVAKVATYGAFPPPQFVQQIIPTPDGSRFFLTSGSSVGVFDAKTVQLLGQTDLGTGGSGAVISLDGKTLYMADYASGVVGAFDTTTLAQTAWVPGFTVNDGQSTIVISAIDETGLIVGPTGHGVGFVDASQMTAARPTVISPNYAAPSTGPTAGGTTVTNFASANVTDSAVLNQIYVGNIPGTSASFANSGNGNKAQVTTPLANQTGAVDLAVVLSDGAVGMAPEGFSYGPTILEVVPNGATAEGGQTGTIIGYGFGSSTSDVQVTVGGQPAPVTALYAVSGLYPFPTTALQFTIPPGIAGTAADVTVTTPSGSFNAAGAFHYTAAVQSFPLTASIQSGIYDAGRDLYYFADQAQIRVLSKSGGWQSPIFLPGTTLNTQLLVLSESPDGTKIAVSDFGGQQIYVLNPDNPSSAKSYPISPPEAPDGLAITNAGIVYYSAKDISGTGTLLFHKLDTATGVITDLGTLQSTGGYDAYDRVLLSPDGSKVYSSVAGGVTGSFWLDTSNDQVNFSNAGYWGSPFPDLAVSGDGSTVVVAGEFADSFLNPQAEAAYIDWETWFPSAVAGQKLNQDGSVLFQPLGDGIDMIARSSGRLLYRIQLPVPPANNWDALVVAAGQNSLAVITTAGISFVDLSILPVAAQSAHPSTDARYTTESMAGRQTIARASKLSIRWPRLKRRLEESNTPVRKR